MSEPETDLLMFETRSCGGDKIAIERCSGAVRRASETQYAEGYRSDAWIPGPCWVPFHFPFARRHAQPIAVHRSLALLRLRDDIVDKVRALPYAESGDPRLEAHDVAIEAAVQAIRDGGEVEASKLRFLRRTKKTCRWPTITQSKADGKQIGLHLDSNSMTALSRRGRVGNRLCVNLGAHERYLLFFGLSLDGMLRRTGAREEFEHDAPGFVDQFFARERPFPVFRLCVPPSHAYVAPTECIVHDGATVPEVDDDIAMFIGHAGIL